MARPDCLEWQATKPTAFYNERDPAAAQWLRNLIAAGHVAPGIVDERDIRDIRPEELHGYTQCHFFAGIGVWSYALRRAGWPDDRPVWTGSCPCQPFSAAGRGDGFADERHLWPHWHWLIAQCRPVVVLGEQVASKDGLGWNDLVSADLEGTGYAFGSVDICAAGLAVEGWEQSQAGQWLRGAIHHCADPEIRRALCDFADWAGAGNLGDGGHHLRQRQYFVAVDHSAGTRHVGPVGNTKGDPRDETRLRLSDTGREDERMADAEREQRLGRRAGGEGGQSGQVERVERLCDVGELADALPAGRPERGAVAGDRPAAGCGASVGMVDGIEPRLEGLAGDGDQCDQPGRVGADTARPIAEAGSDGGVGDGLDDGQRQHRECLGGAPGKGEGGIGQRQRVRPDLADAGPTRWPNAPDSGRDAPDWLFCRDGVWRPVGPGTFPLVDAAPARVVRLRAYGNALDAQTATSFVEAVMAAIKDMGQWQAPEKRGQLDMFEQ